ncbi:MAG: betaine-aldehyde dehydrogenase [Oleibacter sp.]|nr:betaine-aldehyde dehydrogenase [Thalassolituus sp.]
MNTELKLHPTVKSYIENEQYLLIDGQDVAAADKATMETLDPATGKVLTMTAHAGKADVDQAVDSAERAMKAGWATMLPGQRAAILNRLADIIEQRVDEIAELEALDSGKPTPYVAAVDIALGVADLRYCAGMIDKIMGETIPVQTPDLHVFTRLEPIGVVAAIVPWNFAFCQACFKIAPALAAGCSVILKPAEQTPLSAIWLAKAALEAGLPPGVLNVLTGEGETTGQALVDHPGVKKIAFTGSEPVGKHIARCAADTLKHVSLELGGKNPNIIFPDANIEMAAATAAQSIFFYSGQVCTAGSRLMVHKDAYQQVVDIIAEQAKALTLGHGLSEGTTMGPLISQEQLSKVSAYVEYAKQAGIEAIASHGLPDGNLAGGFFHSPTLLLDVKDGAKVQAEEIFGPVLVVQSFEDVDEVIQRANDTTYGLAAGVWSQNAATIHKVANGLESGTVWANTYNVFDAAVPFGGYKQSGYGRDGGVEGIMKYLQSKAVWVNYG